MTTDDVQEPKPCPGSCNRKWRAAEKKADERAHDAVARLRRLTDRDLEVIEHREPVAMGNPAWCTWCAAAIADAIWRIIELTAELWAVGHAGGSSGVTRVVGAEEHLGYAVPLDTIAARAARGEEPVARQVIGYTEYLSCGHSALRAPGTTPKTTKRTCWRCSLETPSGNGQLMPASAESVRSGSGKVKGSPALSPSLLAVDELIAWAVAAEDYLRECRKDPRPPAMVVDAEGWARPLTPDEVLIVGSTKLIESNREMSSAVRYLATHHDELLATPRAVELGKEVLRLERSAGRQSGTESITARLKTACPMCDQKALFAAPRDTHAMCRKCGALSSMDHVHLMVALHGA